MTTLPAVNRDITVVPTKLQEEAMKFTIAVYGTLRKGFINHKHFIAPHIKMGQAKFVAERTVSNFKMYHKHWPLIYPTDVTTDVVIVEVYKVTEYVFENIRAMEEDFQGSPYRCSMIDISGIGWVCSWVLSKAAFNKMQPKEIPLTFRGDYRKFFTGVTKEQYAQYK